MAHKISGNIIGKIFIFIPFLLSPSGLFGDDPKKHHSGSGDVRQERGWAPYQASFLHG